MLFLILALPPLILDFLQVLVKKSPKSAENLDFLDPNFAKKLTFGHNGHQNQTNRKQLCLVSSIKT